MNNRIEAKHPMSGIWERCEYITETKHVRFPDAQVFPVDSVETRVLNDDQIATEEAQKIGTALDQRTLAVLVHLPTRQSAHSTVKLRQVRQWALHAVSSLNKHREASGEPTAPIQDFIVVEVRGDIVRVTSLETYE